MIINIEHITSAMDVWEWVTDHVSDPANPAELNKALTDVFDGYQRQEVQTHCLHFGTLISNFYTQAVVDDWKETGEPYENFVDGMLRAHFEWAGNMALSVASGETLPALYLLMIGRDYLDLTYRELLGQYIEVDPYDDKNLVYAVTTDGEVQTLAAFKPGRWAEWAQRAFEIRQEALRVA